MSNDGKGVAGVNWDSDVYVARVLDAGKVLPTPVSTVSIVWTAMEDLVDYATVHKYERVVVNMSFGSKDPSSVQPDMKAAVELLIESLRDMCVNAASFPLPDGATGRCVICCAAEFYGSAPHAYASYPARFAAEADFPHVISVGSTDAADAVALPASASTEPANEREVTILAPGNASPCTTLLGSTYGVPYQQGASLASPMVAGAVSLMWSTNPTLTPAEIKECLWNTGHSITRGEREYRRLDAGNAVRSAKRTISLDTPVLSFVDVPAGSSDARAVEMSVTACASLTFRVQSTAMDAAFTIDPESMAFDPLTSAGVATGIQVTYTAGAAGSTASGSFVVECEQSLETWTVEITANTAAAPAAAVVLVADKSGSMGAMSGIGTRTRMDVLHDALATTVEVLRPGDACAVVSFDTNATTVQAPVDITNDDPVHPERDPLYTAVNGLSGGGATSIGDGVRLASTLVPTDGARGPALLVVTDGHENTAEFIADVMDEIDVPVYAIGMGTAAVIRPESLESLTNATGGYLLLTDTLDEENRDRVAKYCLQMLVEASGSDLIVDPSGWVRPGQEIDIPFWISGEDRSCDVIVLMPSKGAVDVELVSPGGHRIAKTSRLPGVAFRSGRHTSLYRLDTAEGRGVKGAVGRWKARLSISEASAKSHAKRLKGRQRVRFDAHGAPYCALVSCRSAVKMTARAYAASHEPGSRVLLRTVITERSLPLHSPAAVTARISFPDGTQSPCTLRRVAPGVNEYELTARLPGVYTCRVRATGLTALGERYQREQTITAHIWNGPRGTVSLAPRGPSRPR
jgi:Mg-chelatase subunit ChlD